MADTTGQELESVRQTLRSTEETRVSLETRLESSEVMAIKSQELLSVSRAANDSSRTSLADATACQICASI